MRGLRVGRAAGGVLRVWVRACRDAISAADVRQQLDVLRLDKEHLTATNQDLKNTCQHLRGQLQDCQQNIRDLTKSREEAYERLLAAKQEHTAAFERQLHAEVDAIREKNKAELEDLRASSRQIYEQEARGFRNERDSAQAARREAEIQLRETTERLETVQESHRALQMQSETTIGDLRSQLKLQEFESNRTRVLFEETQANLKVALIDIKSLQEKVTVATGEFMDLKSSSDARIAMLEATAHNSRSGLAAYEQLESELDGVVMEAAEAEDPNSVLLSYGYGSNVPSTAKRRLKQSILLARKLLAIQKELRAAEAVCTFRFSCLRLLRCCAAKCQPCRTCEDAVTWWLSYTCVDVG
eukprot:m.54323 g.54323  ORF g.54323 m.54323 type:complete len:356 (+) comp15507_c0_seq3:194-1261(+)